MTLREKQVIFAELVSDLIKYIVLQGYDVTIGEAWRSQEEAARLAKLGKGIKNSLHCVRLAIDLNLFKDGKYLTDTEDYRKVGIWWEMLSSKEYECIWGGRFNDGNHFSIAHGGRK